MEESTEELINLEDDAQIEAEAPNEENYEGEYKEYSKMYGVYPNINDEDFITRILQKREFSDSQQYAPFKADGTPIGKSPCDQDEFEATPVQRFIGNFMSPDTPYKSMLLYHGVGVGKTCAGVTVAERFLATYPRRKVFIVAPPSIQYGFQSTIFSKNKVTIPEDPDMPNTTKQCTGNTYLHLTNTIYEKRLETIEYRTGRAINQRYEFFGYISLKNYIKKLLEGVPKTLDPERREQVENGILNTHFGGRLLIIDEAHNIRDTPSDVAEPEIEVDSSDDKNDIKSAKELTPYLMRVLRVSEGLKLLLLTGTPMYNTHNEIIFLMNLINTNEGKPMVRDADVFTTAGEITPIGEKHIAEFASRHVSFMRGENPLSFPMRLMPLNREFRYPDTNPNETQMISAGDKVVIEKLPIIANTIRGQLEEDYFAHQKKITSVRGGMSPISLESLVQAGNFIWPVLDEENNDIEGRIGMDGFNSAFEIIREVREKREGEKRERLIIPRRYKPRGTDPSWMFNVGAISPKCERVLASVSKAEGVCFVFSRFVQSGALPIALILEAYGFAPYGRQGLLEGGPKHPGGRICVCGKYEKEHEGIQHPFKQATYALLTGDRVLTPKVDTIVKASQAPENKDGSIIKVIIGSQIASEGIDLRYIREVHIFDSWFHLNKTEQIIGRAIRFCSHSLLPQNKRNTTIYLHVNVFENHSVETADLYSYRFAYKKAKKVGQVTRLIKQYAVDCNLTHSAVLFSGYPPLIGDKRPIDSQGIVREGEEINDMPFTAVCDWLETCDFKCAVQLPEDKGVDEMTYSKYAAAWREARMRDVLRRVFAEQVFLRIDSLPDMFRGVSLSMVMELLASVINNKNFVVEHKDKKGYLIYKNKYILFQPMNIIDTIIPMAMRAANYPVKRDIYAPRRLEIEAAPERPMAAAKMVSDINTAWTSIKRWLIELMSNPDTYIPAEMNMYIETISNGDPKQAAIYRRDKVNTIRFLAKTIPKQYLGALFNVLIEYIWDIWLPIGWKASNWKGAFSEMVGNHQKYLVENLMNIEGIEIYRYFDMDTKDIKYMCGDKPCPLALVEQIRTMPDIFEEEVSSTTTGAIYGFLTYKKDQIVFKTNNPPDPGQKLGPGKECENDTKTSSHKAKIYEVMGYLAPVIKSDLGLTEAGGVLGGEIINPAQTCLLLELLLRFMDEMGLGEHRWFYRIIEAFSLGHKGRK